MPTIGWFEILIIVAIAIVVLGPKDFPIMLKKVGLAKRLNHYPSQLSGGEKQRVSIARALINNPQIILADEPTGSLDIETAKGIFELLKKQIKPDRIIIIATHNRFFANKSDCLLEIVDGNIKTING